MNVKHTLKRPSSIAGSHNRTSPQNSIFLFAAPMILTALLVMLFLSPFSALAAGTVQAAPVESSRNGGNSGRILSITEEDLQNMLAKELGGYWDAPEENYEKVKGIIDKIKFHTVEPFMEYQVKFVNSEIPNAFAQFPRTIFITKGLWKVVKNDDELAFILAHEMSHILRRHGISQQMLNNIITLGTILTNIFSRNYELNAAVNIASQTIMPMFSRNDELDADKWAAFLCYRAGYDPNKGIDFLVREASSVQLGVTSSHPTNFDRRMVVNDIMWQEMRSKETNPDDAMKDFMRKWRAGDWKGMRSFLAYSFDWDKDETDTSIKSLAGKRFASYELTKIDSDFPAHYILKIHGAGESKSTELWRFGLYNEMGQWKITKYAQVIYLKVDDLIGEIEKRFPTGDYDGLAVSWIEKADFWGKPIKILSFEKSVLGPDDVELRATAEIDGEKANLYMLLNQYIEGWFISELKTVD